MFLTQCSVTSRIGLTSSLLKFYNFDHAQKDILFESFEVEDTGDPLRTYDYHEESLCG